MATLGRAFICFRHLSLMSSRALGLALLGLSLAIVVQRARDLPSNRGLALVLLLAPWVYMVTWNYYLGTRPRIETLLFPAVVLAVWALRPRLDRLALLGWLTGVTALIGVVLGAFLPSKGILTAAAGGFIAPEKEILPWGILIGPFSDGNNFGQFLALGLPAVARVRNRLSRALLALLIVFAVVWTSSRSSLAAIAVGAFVLLVLGAVETQRLTALVDALAEGDAATALTLMHEIVTGGVDLLDFADQITEYLRDLMVAAYCSADDELLAGAAADAETLTRQVALFTPERLIYMIQVLREAKLRARRDTVGRLAMELAVNS